LSAPADAESYPLTVDATRMALAAAAASPVGPGPFPGAGPFEPAMSNENVVGVAPARIAKAGVEAQRVAQRRLVGLLLFLFAGCVHRVSTRPKQMADQKKLSLVINQFARHRRAAIRSS
jgi:hypothetical protein